MTRRLLTPPALIAGLIVLVVATTLTGSTRAEQEGGSPTGATKERKIKYWVAPMDPTYISDKPGKSPMGMDLVPVYEDEAPSGDSSTITIDPVVVQNMGVRVLPARRDRIVRKIRTVAQVEVAEDRLSVVNLRFSGWIEKLYADETGKIIDKGAPLFDIYSPELVSAQEEYLLALRRAGTKSALARSARRRLAYWGLTSRQIDAIAASGRVQSTLRIRAPQTGYILEKKVLEGAHVAAGRDLFRIADLSKVWIEAEVYESDAPWIRLGQQADIDLTFQPGQAFSGTLSYIYPTLDMTSRTLRVRIEVDNPDLRLKPGMFATINIAAASDDDVVLVPTEAIIHSGERQIVFVSPSFGHYDKRQIRTGRVGDQYVTEVLEGIEPGELVVTSGQFLLDSESQLQEAIQKMLDARLQKKGKTPAGTVAAGGEKAASEGAAAGEHSGSDDHSTHSYWTCSMHPQVVEDEPGTCPICGMTLVERKR